MTYRNYIIIGFRIISDDKNLHINTAEVQFMFLLCIAIRIFAIVVTVACSSGSSKGYGFVEFACDQQESEVIRCKLERKSVSNSVLHCDFMKETITDFDQLNSSCLYVGNLPPDFGDDSHLREVFGVVTDPLFCRVRIR